ncbi:MAG: CHRD domain-containing protein [Acidobacteriota bacterium]
MKRYAMMAGAVLLATACGSSNPAGPSAPANTVIFSAALSAANERPNPITNADANARGTATITMNLTRNSAGTITGATTTFVYNLTAFPAGTQVRLSHIHVGDAATAGAVVWDTGLTAANAITLNDGTLTNQTFSNTPGPTDPATLAQQIIDNPAGYYFNVHTVLNPGGAVRGQLVRQQ